jgi:hypothetical protein
LAGREVLCDECLSLWRIKDLTHTL